MIGERPGVAIGVDEDEAGEAFDPSPANIESRLQRATLPNGMKLVMLPKKTRGGAVIAYGGIAGGWALHVDADRRPVYSYNFFHDISR